MSTVHYQEGFVDDLPLLFFDYGIMELGTGTPFLEPKIRAMLMRQGMRESREQEDFPIVTVKPVVEGNTLFIPWYEEAPPDEMEMSEEWLKGARAIGAFVAIYLNLRPDLRPSDLSMSKLRSMGALMGLIALDGS